MIAQTYSNIIELGQCPQISPLRQQLGLNTFYPFLLLTYSCKIQHFALQTYLRTIVIHKLT